MTVTVTRRYCAICGWEWHVAAILVAELPKRKLYVCWTCAEAIRKAKYFNEDQLAAVGKKP
jgi:protein-arginine kinase activator protein McsA